MTAQSLMLIVVRGHSNM